MSNMTEIVIGIVLGFLALLVTVFLLFTASICHMRWRYRKIAGPKCTSFYQGHLPEIRKIYATGKYHSQLFLDWTEQFSSSPVIKLFLLNKCLLIVTSQAMVKELMTKSKYPKAKFAYSRLYDVCGARFLGNGLVTTVDHHAWHRKRVVVDPVFKTRFLKKLMDQFNTSADAWIERLRDYADTGQVFSMAEVLSRITLDVVAKIAFNLDTDAINNNESPFPHALDTVLKGLAAEVRNPYMKYHWKNWQLVSDVKSAVKVLREMGKECLEERLNARKNGQPDVGDILDQFVLMKENNPDLGLEELLDEFSTLFIAGQETISNALAFLIGEVGRNPEIMQKVVDEVDEVVGTSNYISFERLSKLDYMYQVWQETLRLYPPAPGTARDIPDDLTLDGVSIPGGSHAVISYYIIQRQSKHYENPTEFRPDRFAAEKDRPLFAYLPFSMGHRSCLGQYFARIEAKILLAKLLQRYTFKLDMNQSFDIHETSTLKPQGGTMLSLQLR